MSTPTTTTVETLREVRASQTIWVDWMRDATAGLTDDDLVQATRKVTPFGTYLVDVASLREVRRRVASAVEQAVIAGDLAEATRLAEYAEWIDAQ